MNLLHIITGLGNGGAEAVLLRLVSDKRQGIRHQVISLTDRGVYAEALERAGIAVHVLHFPRGKFTVKGVVGLYKLIRRIKPDVVQTWMYHSDLIGGAVARCAGVRSIVWGVRHANLDPEHNSRATLQVVRLCAFISKWVPMKIVTCSEQAMHLHKAAGYQAEKFVQIPNGYNMERLKPDFLARKKIRSELGATDDRFLLGMVARFDAQKDHLNLINALGLLKSHCVEFTCFLVGSGIEQKNDILYGWIKDAGLVNDVVLLGPRTDIPDFMNALDVNVLSSLGEAFPNVLAEAMACGVPCVTTNVGDAALIVGEYGWVVAPQDASALADGLIRAHKSFLENKEEWQKLKVACRSHIMANFELERMCERYRHVWEACMHDH